MKTEWLKILQVMIRLTVQIDNWQHEWHMKRNKQHAPVVIAHQKLTISYHDSYELQLIDLDIIYEHSEWFKETGCFQRKENSSNTKGVKYYNCDFKEYYAWECHKLKKSQSITATK